MYATQKPKVSITLFGEFHKIRNVLKYFISSEATGVSIYFHKGKDSLANRYDLTADQCKTGIGYCDTMCVWNKVGMRTQMRDWEYPRYASGNCGFPFKARTESESAAS